MSYIYFINENGHLLELDEQSKTVRRYAPLIPAVTGSPIKQKKTSSLKEVPVKKKKRKCKACGEAGHRSDNCKFEKGDDIVIPKETIRIVMEMKHEGMRTDEEIADETDLDLETVKKILGKKK